MMYSNLTLILPILNGSSHQKRKHTIKNCLPVKVGLFLEAIKKIALPMLCGGMVKVLEWQGRLRKRDCKEKTKRQRVLLVTRRHIKKRGKSYVKKKRR